MRKRIIIGLLLVLIITMITGCKTKTKEDPNPKLTAQEIATIEDISKLVFQVEKESLKVTDLTEEQKAEIARNLPVNGYTESTGKEMTELFQKYFGSTQTVTFENIMCDMDHGNEEEQVLYIFDKEQDKYIYNEKHPGHGGGGKDWIGTFMKFEGIEIEKNQYIGQMKVLFYGSANCPDIGPCSYGKAYKTYEDAKNGVNAIDDIDGNDAYWNKSDDDFPELQEDKLMEALESQLDTYNFAFEKEGENLIFIEYKK